MSIQTIDLNGTPWLVCEAENSAEPRDVARKSGLDLSKVKVRQATPEEAAVLKVERLLAEKEGRDPSKIFGVQLRKFHG